MANIRQRIEALEKQKRVRKIATTVVPPNVIQVTSDLSSLEDRVTALENGAFDNNYGFTSYAYAVWSGSGLTFNVFYSSYYINGTLYAAGSGNITLNAADGTNPRLDVIAVDATGGIKITGTPAADPVKPTVDTLTQLEITFILVEAGATTPANITDENIYTENAEWTGSSDVSGADFADTTDPFAGTKHVDIDSFSAGKYVQFVDGSTHDISDYNYLKFYVKLKATFSNSTGFILYFKNGTTAVSSTFTVTNGIYNFDRTDTSGYQLIVIPLSEFTFTSATFDTLYIELKGSNATGFRLDNVVLQGGISGFSVEQNALVTIETDSGAAAANQANDTFNLLGKLGTIVDASGKTINIEGIAGATASGTDTYTATITGVTAYTAGQIFKIKFTNANTGASTLNINSLGAIALKKSSTTALSSGDINAGQAFLCYYDGTNFQIIGIGGGGGVSFDRNAVSISSGTLTLDFDSKRIKNFDLTSTVSSAFTIAFSNTTNLVQGRLTLRVTGSVAITMPSSVIMDRYEVLSERWNTSTNILTITGDTASPFMMEFIADSSSNVWCKCGYKGE